MRGRNGIRISVLAALVLVGIAGTDAAVPGLVGEWHFDGNAQDTSGNGNDGTISGATFVQGISGQALSFDGVDDYVDAGESNSLKITGDQLTMMAWINANGNAGPNNIIINKEGEYEFGITNSLSEQIKDNNIWWAVANTNPGWDGRYPNYAINLNEWYFVVVVYDGNSVKTYINGIIVHSLAASGTIGDSQIGDVFNKNKLWIGWRQNQNTNPFKGLIDEVRIYNRALSASEIQTNFNAIASPDTIPPSITISSPSSGQTSTASTIIVSGTALDNIALNRVEVNVGAGIWQLASGTASWGAQVTLSQGMNTIYARATDTSGNIADTSVTISYNPPAPIVTTLPPAPIATPTPTPFTGTISVSSSPSDASIYLDGSYQRKTPFIITDVPAGSHLVELRLNGYKEWADTIQVKAGSTSYVSVQLIPAETALTPTYTIKTPDIERSPPSISISKPEPVDFNKNKQLDEGEKLVITYGANDESGIKSIKVSLDGNLIELRSNEGIYSVTTDSLSIGEHTIVIEAVDLKGNKKSEEMKVSAKRAGPSIYPQKSKYEVSEGEDVNVLLAAVNPIGNPKMDAQLVLKPPTNGVSVYESDCKGYAGICTSNFEIEPGDSVKPVSVRMRADKAGEYQIDTEVYYQYEDGQRSPPRYETLTMVVKPKPQTPSLVSTPAPLIPGSPSFGAIINISIGGVSLGLGGLLLRIFLKRRQ